MKTLLLFFASLAAASGAADWSLYLARDGRLTASPALSNGVVFIERTNTLPSSPTNWVPLGNYFTTTTNAIVTLPLTNPAAFFRARHFDLSGGDTGFSNFVAAYSTLTTVAGAGGATGAGVNKWSAAFENGPAASALLSRPHIALGDDAGNIYIADKDAHGIRKVRTDGTIFTVAGTSAPGNGPDTATPATQVALSEPNGLWVRADGTFYILDLGNSKVRKVDTNGTATTLFSVPGGLPTGRGLWVSDDESLAFAASGTIVKKWTAGGGVVNFATGFIDLGNLVLDPAGLVVVTERGGHSVSRLSADGATRTRIAGTGAVGAGVDGAFATNCPLNQVRGIWFLPTGGYLLATDNGSQVWYVDLEARIHLLLNGSTGHTHSGDGAYFYDPAVFKVSKVRAVTLDREGNMLITEHDAGYVRKVRFLPR